MPVIAKDEVSMSGIGKLAVVVPTYNEAKNIGNLIRSLHEVFDRHGLDGYIVVVDDNSPDGTADIAEEAGRIYGKVFVIRRPRKLGLGSAYMDGFKYAIEGLKADYVVEMDADGSHPPEELPGLIDALRSSDADCVTASRYIKGGGWMEGSMKRVLVSRVANMLARISTGLRLRDTTSGYRVYRSDALRRMELGSLEKGYVFQVQVLYELSRKGCRLVEKPFTFMPRVGGSSKLNPSEITRFIVWCIRTMLERMRGRTKV